MQKQTVIFEENPKLRIYKGKLFCQIGPLSRDRARILYLIIIWQEPNNSNRFHLTYVRQRRHVGGHEQYIMCLLMSYVTSVPANTLV